MNYELAKQLKDAGYPGIKICEDKGKPGHFDEECDESIPELSELITACGDKFKGLFSPYSTFCGDIKILQWAAIEVIGETKRADDTPGFFMNWTLVMGSTPEEAVANLWLGSHRK